MRRTYSKMHKQWLLFGISLLGTHVMLYMRLQKPIGIIALLDEAWYNTNSLLSIGVRCSFVLCCLFILLLIFYSCSMFPKSTHETFSNKLFQNFRTHPRLEKEKFSETDFTISHYAGKVCLLCQKVISYLRIIISVSLLPHCIFSRSPIRQTHF